MHARCAICSDLFDFIQDIAATLCGHIFHSMCLAQWLNQSKTCPQCRLKVTKDKIIHKLYFDIDDQSDENANTSSNNVQLMNEIESCKANLAASNREKIELLKKIDEFEDTVKLISDQKQGAQAELWECKNNCKVFKRELRNMEIIKHDNAEMKSELSDVMKKLNSFQNLKTIAENATRDVEEMIDKCGYKPHVEEVLKWHSIVRRELMKSDTENKKLKLELEKTQKEKKKSETKLIETEAILNDIKEERENMKCSNCLAEIDTNSPKLTPNSQVFYRAIAESPKLRPSHYSNNEAWTPLSPEILPDKLTNSRDVLKKRDNSCSRNRLTLTTKRHMSDSSVSSRLKFNSFQPNGWGGFSKSEIPFPKAKEPKLTLMDNFITLN